MIKQCKRSENDSNQQLQLQQLNLLTKTENKY